MHLLIYLFISNIVVLSYKLNTGVTVFKQKYFHICSTLHHINVYDCVPYVCFYLSFLTVVFSGIFHGCCFYTVQSVCNIFYLNIMYRFVILY